MIYHYYFYQKINICNVSRHMWHVFCVCGNIVWFFYQKNVVLFPKDGENVSFDSMMSLLLPGFYKALFLLHNDLKSYIISDIEYYFYHLFHFLFGVFLVEFIIIYFHLKFNIFIHLNAMRCVTSIDIWNNSFFLKNKTPNKKKTVWKYEGASNIQKKNIEKKCSRWKIT